MSAKVLEKYKQVRDLSELLVLPLSEADAQIQSMDDASPAKWHLAHTTWFFETLVLLPHLKSYKPFHPEYQYLFNSYYNGIGKQYLRAARGMLSRPSLKEVIEYRRHVDEHMQALLEDSPQSDCLWLITLGLNHEQQHQELLLTDIKHAFYQNPLLPSYQSPSHADETQTKQSWIEINEGLYNIGTDENNFAFDNESPKHKVFVQSYALSNQLVTNGEYIEFINDDGYRNPQLWLSDGWSHIQKNALTSPLYWQQSDSGEYHEFTLAGMQPLLKHKPAVHISYYEADAFARWKGVRLPTEFEWEIAAASLPIDGSFLTLQKLHPQSIHEDGLTQMFGQCWQWTSSAYSAYPGYKPFQGAVGEYNGKFMSGQQVLRGGSCVTPRSSYRHTYRNFFYPHQAWQFSGIRLAK